MRVCCGIDTTPVYDAPAEVTAPAGFGTFLTLIWSKLPSATALISAAASAKLFLNHLQEHFKDTSFSMETVTLDPRDKTTAYTRIEFKNLSPDSYATIMDAMQKFAAQERSRTVAIPDAAAVPTPDNVVFTGDSNVLGLIEAEPSQAVNGAPAPPKVNGLTPA